MYRRFPSGRSPGILPSWLGSSCTPAWASRFYAFLRGVAWVAILQVLLGFLLFLQGLRPKDGLHLLYGLLLAAGLHYLGGLEPGGWFYRGLKDPPKRPELFVALGLLFCVGLVLRVYLTGR